MRSGRFLALDILLCGLALPLGALWPASAEADWPVDGVMLAPPGVNSPPFIASDGRGGAIVTWHSGVASDVFAQRITASGSIADGWPSGGLVVCTAPSLQECPVAVSDSLGGAIIAWQDSRAGTNYDIYAQRITATGQVAEGWPVNGRAVCAAAGNQYSPVIVADGRGGAIVAWYDGRSGSGNYDIYAQRITGSGKVAQGWPSGGLAVCTAPQHQLNPAMEPDGLGGAFIVWQDCRTGTNYDIYASRVTSDGAIASGWPSGGLGVCTAANSQSNPVVAPDGAGGVYVAWQDYGSAENNDIYLQRLMESGVVAQGWPAGGRAVCTAQNSQYYPVVSSDGASGVFIFWQDFRNGIDNDVYGAHFLSSGAPVPGWPADGEAICAEVNGQYSPRSTADGMNGAFVTWYDNRVGSTDDIYAQHVDYDGSLAASWPKGGLALCLAANSQYYPVIVAGSDGNAIVAWQDQRGGEAGAIGIYGQHVVAPQAAGVRPDEARSWVEPPRPNPFRRSMTVALTLESARDVKVEVFDAAGRRVQTLASGRMKAGRHQVEWDGRVSGGPVAPAGLYFVRTRLGATEATRRVVRLR